MMRLLILLLAASLTFAQEKPAETKPEPAREAEIIQVRTLTGDSFDRLVSLLKVFQVYMTSDSQMRTIIIYAPKDVTAQVRRVVEQLDRPGSEAALGKDIEMTLTLLRCSTKPPASPGTLPPDIEAVAKQLRTATQYKDIQLLDVLPLRLQEGRDSSDSIHLPGGAPGQPITGTASFHPQAVYRKDQGRYVRFSRVRIQLRVPYGNPASGFQYIEQTLDTSGDFMEGQKTVLGKVSGVNDDEAMFAVIALKVLD
jgi:hypothetical protein